SAAKRARSRRRASKGKTFRAASWYVRAFAAASCSTTNGLAAAALDGRNGPRTMIVWSHHSWVSEILRMGRTPGFPNDPRGVADPRIARQSGGGRRDPLGRDVVLVSLAVVVGDDRVDRVGPDQIVDESDGSPVLDETADRELPEEVLSLPAPRTKGLSGFRPHGLDLVPPECA